MKLSFILLIYTYVSSGDNQENVTAVAVLGSDSSPSSSASASAASLNKSKAGESRSRAELDYEPDFFALAEEAENNEVLTSLRPKNEEKDDAANDEYFEEKTDVAISLNSEPAAITTTAKQTAEAEMKGKNGNSKNYNSTGTKKTEKENLNSPVLNYEYEEVPLLPYESYEDYYSSVVAATHSGEFFPFF